MAWIILITAGVFESVWVIALPKTQGFKKLLPTLVFVIASVISLGGLALAMREIQLGTAYAVWVAVGAVITVAYSLITKKEASTVLKIGLMLLLIAMVVGLKLVS